MSSTAQTAEGEKILIVDDDPGLSSLLERFFNSKGYRARAVPNTEQMDRLLGREVFNLVVRAAQAFAGGEAVFAG